MADLVVCVQGVMGKEGKCQRQGKVGVVIDRYKQIVVDVFQGEGESYKEREKEEITVIDNGKELFCGDFEELAKALLLDQPSDEEAGAPIQDALYATGRFTTDQCDQLTDGILQYIDDAGYKIGRKS